MQLNKWESAFWAAWQASRLVTGDDLQPRLTIGLEIDGEMLAREFDLVDRYIDKKKVARN